MRFWIGLALLAWLLAPPGCDVFAQTTPGKAVVGAGSSVRVPVRADSRIWLEGSSNVRDWTCKATEMDATIEVETPSVEGTSGSDGARGVKAVVVKVPVKKLKCGDRHMEAQMYSALKASDPAGAYIEAHFDRLPEAVITGQTVETSGQLTIAGMLRTVRMTVSSNRLPDGTRRARGTVPILMTDFGIKPPRPWGGILRTADKVLIQFEIFIAPII